MKRKGLGKGLGMGYKNIAPLDSHIHSLSAKGVKTLQRPSGITQTRFKDTRTGEIVTQFNLRDIRYMKKLDAKGKMKSPDYVPVKSPKYEYVWGGDVFDDNNEGLLFGVEDVSDFPEYVEWFPSVEAREKNSKKFKMNVVNRVQHFNYLKNRSGLNAKGWKKQDTFNIVKTKHSLLYVNETYPNRGIHIDPSVVKGGGWWIHITNKKPKQFKTKEKALQFVKDYVKKYPKGEE